MSALQVCLVCQNAFADASRCKRDGSPPAKCSEKSLTRAAPASPLRVGHDPDASIRRYGRDSGRRQRRMQTRKPHSFASSRVFHLAKLRCYLPAPNFVASFPALFLFPNPSPSPPSTHRPTCSACAPRSSCSGTATACLQAMRADRSFVLLGDGNRRPD